MDGHRGYVMHVLAFHTMVKGGMELEQPGIINILVELILVYLVANIILSKNFYDVYHIMKYIKSWYSVTHSF